MLGDSRAGRWMTATGRVKGEPLRGKIVPRERKREEEKRVRKKRGELERGVGERERPFGLKQHLISLCKCAFPWPFSNHWVLILFHLTELL